MTDSIVELVHLGTGVQLNREDSALIAEYTSWFTASRWCATFEAEAVPLATCRAVWSEALGVLATVHIEAEEGSSVVQCGVWLHRPKGEATSWSVEIEEGELAALSAQTVWFATDAGAELHIYKHDLLTGTRQAAWTTRKSLKISGSAVVQPNGDLEWLHSGEVCAISRRQGRETTTSKQSAVAHLCVAEDETECRVEAVVAHDEAVLTPTSRFRDDVRGCEYFLDDPQHFVWRLWDDDFDERPRLERCFMLRDTKAADDTFCAGVHGLVTTQDGDLLALVSFRWPTRFGDTEPHLLRLGERDGAWELLGHLSIEGLLAFCRAEPSTLGEWPNVLTIDRDSDMLILVGPAGLLTCRAGDVCDAMTESDRWRVESTAAKQLDLFLGVEHAGIPIEPAHWWANSSYIQLALEHMSGAGYILVPDRASAAAVRASLLHVLGVALAEGALTRVLVSETATEANVGYEFSESGARALAEAEPSLAALLEAIVICDSCDLKGPLLALTAHVTHSAGWSFERVVAHVKPRRFTPKLASAAKTDSTSASASSRSSSSSGQGSA